jgi:hypothetical protein
MKPRRPTFVIKLQPIRSDSGDIRGLRWILKTLLRRHGFRCITACEESSTPKLESKNA